MVPDLVLVPDFFLPPAADLLLSSQNQAEQRALYHLSPHQLPVRQSQSERKSFREQASFLPIDSFPMTPLK